MKSLQDTIDTNKNLQRMKKKLLELSYRDLGRPQ